MARIPSSVPNSLVDRNSLLSCALRPSYLCLLQLGLINQSPGIHSPPLAVSGGGGYGAGGGVVSVLCLLGRVLNFG